jgi:transposase
VTANGIAWKKLPTELGFGSGITCWRRMRAWQEAEVWEKLHHAVLDQLGQDGALDWSRTCLDSGSVRAKGGGELTGPNPTDRGIAAEARDDIGWYYQSLKDQDRGKVAEAITELLDQTVAATHQVRK